MAKDENRLADWTKGLPSNDELTSLSHMLISPILANAFRIKRDEPMTEEDVRRESQATLHNLFHQSPSIPVFDAFPVYQEQEDEGAYEYRKEGRNNAPEFQGKLRVEEEFRGNRRVEEGLRDEFGGNRRVEEGLRDEFGGNRRAEERRHDSRSHSFEEVRANDTTGPSKGDDWSNVGQGLQPNTAREEDPSTTPVEQASTQSPGQSSSPYLMNTRPYRPYPPEVEAAENGSFEMEDTNSAGGGAMSSKRARLVWTPQLHKRFVETVGHLGIKNAVPKTIMQLMNVEGLTRENVASHLQKYRLYLKHMQGDDSSFSASDHLFASTPVPLGMGPQDGPFTTPVVPMHFQGLVRPGPPFRRYGEPAPYGPGYMMEQPAVVPERTPEASSEKQSRNTNNQPGPSSKYVLPLFPTN